MAAPVDKSQLRMAHARLPSDFAVPDRPTISTRDGASSSVFKRPHTASPQSRGVLSPFPSAGHAPRRYSDGAAGYRDRSRPVIRW